MLCTLTTGLLGLPGWLGVVKPGVVEMPGLEPCANAAEPAADRYNAMPDATTNLFMNSPSNVYPPNFTTSSRQRFTVLPLPDTAWVGQNRSRLLLRLLRRRFRIYSFNHLHDFIVNLAVGGEDVSGLQLERRAVDIGC